MKKTLNIIAIVLTFSIISCTDYFEEMNTDPNSFTDPSIDLILPNVIISAAYSTNTEALRNVGGAYGQYLVNLMNLDIDRFVDRHGDFASYLQIRHAKAIYDKAEKLNYPNRMGVALILQTYIFAKLTDEMGDIPYSEAIDYETSIYPSYDKQEDIYLGKNGLLATLEEANTLLSTVQDGLDKNADILYGGDILKWRRFANSLRIRLLMRISDKVDVKDKIKEIINNSEKYPIFRGNSDNAALPYINKSSSYASPFGVSTNNGNIYYNERAACATIVELLKSINDPRLKTYFNPIPSNPDEYIGIPTGIGSPSNFNGGEQNYSRLNNKFKEDANEVLPAKMMNYSELMFLLAEAAQKSYFSGNAENYYIQGIQSSFEYWKIQPSDSYYQQESVAYNGTLKQIITQKWIANFCVGSEGWFDYRRTGFPDFYIGPATSLNGSFIQRLMYPTTEESTNLNSLKKAIEQQGPNDNITKMWYLKK